MTLLGGVRRSEMVEKRPIGDSGIAIRRSRSAAMCRLTG
jgi:hypothetical protein